MIKKNLNNKTVNLIISKLILIYLFFITSIYLYMNIHMHHIMHARLHLRANNIKFCFNPNNPKVHLYI